MNRDQKGLVIGACLFIAGVVLGWELSASQIARECSKVGGFLVGGSVFTCKERT